ncbi:MAG TPA: HAD family phosphatase [Bryobacteraceae bacterium]|jgi:HAD superfamily hydrolase (TIGR01509 family)|nr:HAD family phosphatase [Bryobacteraceae bacterium]
MSFSAVIFDMDGLMLDTEPVYKIAWQRAAESRGFPISDALYFELIGRTRAAGEAILREAFGAGFEVEAFRAACERCETVAFAERLPARKPGLDVLLALLDLHRVPKAVATSTDRPVAEAMLREHGLLNRFRAMVTGSDISNGKPAPDIFLLAARRLGVAPATCLVLEDSEAGIVAASRAGMHVYAVPDLKPPPPEIERLARGTFDSLADVAEELRRQFAAGATGGLATTVLV